MFFRRIKVFLGERKQAILLVFEVVHFLINVIIVVHIVTGYRRGL